MTRTTSAKAYREETENGNITKKQRQVWEYLKANGPATGRKISAAIPGGWKRLAELKRKGYATDYASIVDKSTGKTAIEWGFCYPDEVLFVHPTTVKDTRKQLEAKLEAAEQALKRTQMALDRAITSMGRCYDKGYLQGREDETNGVKMDD